MRTVPLPSLNDAGPSVGRWEAARAAWLAEPDNASLSDEERRAAAFAEVAAVRTPADAAAKFRMFVTRILADHEDIAPEVFNELAAEIEALPG